MAKGYYIFVLIFFLFFESLAQISLEKTIIGPIKTVPKLSDTIPPTLNPVDSSTILLLKKQLSPLSTTEKILKRDSILSMTPFGDKTGDLDEHNQVEYSQYFDDELPLGYIRDSLIEQSSAFLPLNGLGIDSLTKNSEIFKKALHPNTVMTDSANYIFQKADRVPSSDAVKGMYKDSLLSNALVQDKLRKLEGNKPHAFKKDLTGDFRFDKPESFIDKLSLDTLFNGQAGNALFKDKTTFQEGFKSQFTDEIGDEIIAVDEVKQKHVVAKRVLSVKDRGIVDSLRSIASDKLYNIKDEVQDSLSLFLVSEKRKLKDNMFFEGLVSMDTYKDNVSVSDFSGSLGLRLKQFYEVGMGPEIGVSGNDFSAIGARLFARRKIFEEKLFVIVENSFRRNGQFSEAASEADGLSSNLKLGAGRLFNLSPNGETKLNIQTLLNPQSLNDGGYNNVVDLRLGISKLSRK
ncbi:hypothetical protein J2X69_002413 [Algoriphagus sp. 4150]|uniref:hypothetical protein n=1 Tax=Algoriphagus sp. 4150 TaxID=2817756 RepID=UPI00285E10A6|nr:hypothetical protein [Algoriphagus sp. 4150]MDR7130066.1 hypothetical protein [Algoriphagus sp. 4150]